MTMISTESASISVLFLHEGSNGNEEFLDAHHGGNEKRCDALSNSRRELITVWILVLVPSQLSAIIVWLSLSKIAICGCKNATQIRKSCKCAEVRERTERRIFFIIRSSTSGKTKPTNLDTVFKISSLATAPWPQARSRILLFTE
jgi:hypothetical protein